MRIVCATNMPLAAEAFGTLGDVTILEGRRITAADVRDADLLAVRSTTRVDRELLHGSRVRFVGTATIGTDHLDKAYLENAGIQWGYAPGCNANSVSEYVTAALLWLEQQHAGRLEGKTIGIIGVGNVGRRVALKAAALGLRVLLNDPPRARVGDREDFQPLARLLAEADILTLHVPLSATGPDATRHMADARFFERVRRGVVFINAARGAVVRTPDLIAALDNGSVAQAVIDTWEAEPCISRELLQRADLATPHIAGHSFEGKAEGTLMVYRDACRFLGVAADWDHRPYWPPPPVPRFELDNAEAIDDQAMVHRAVRAVYDIERDDRDLRAATTGTDTQAAAAFDALRRNYPERREFRFTQVALPKPATAARTRCRDLGFQVSE